MPEKTPPTPEHQRLQEATAKTARWKFWGAYLSERQWGTVREDYSPAGAARNYFTHDEARSRAYRWGEEVLAGLSPEHGRWGLGPVLCNGRHSILKERLSGVTN